MSSTVKRERVHCEKQKGACQKTVMWRVQYSMVALNTVVFIVA